MPDPIANPLTTDDGGAPLRLALRAKDAALALAIGERKLWELTNRNLIPHVRIGKAIVYPVELLRQWLAEQAIKGG